MSYLLHKKQSFMIKHEYFKQINKYLYCYELQLFSGLFLFWYQDILNRFSCLVHTCFQYVLYKFKRHSKLHLNSYSFKNLLTFASGYLVKLCKLNPQLSLETVFPVLKLTQICCINMNIFFLKTGNFKIKNWLPLYYSHIKLERVSSQYDKIWK